MSDFASSLPVRTESAGDVIARLVDGTTTANFLGIDASGRIVVKLADKSGTGITSQLNGAAQQALDVGINVAGVQIDPRLTGQYNSALPTLSSGAFTALQTNANGVLLTSPEGDIFPATQTITTQDTTSTTTAVFNQSWVSGTPSAGSAASFTNSSNETGMIEVTGTWTGTLVVEVSVDNGTNWIAHQIHLLGSTIFTSSLTGNATGSINLAANTNVRVRATTAWTGSATVKLTQSINSSSIYVANAVKLVDGSSATSSTLLNILAASTAASATNTAVVVALSPNSPTPAGTNTIGKVAQDNTTQWLVKDLADGPVTPGTVAAFSMLMGGQYNSTLPTLTTGQQAAVQLDASGRVLVANPASAVANLNATVRLQDGAGTNITSTTAGAKQLLDTNMRDASGNPYTSANPFPVTVSSVVPGTPVQAALTSSSLAVGATANLDYTVTTGKTLSLARIWSTASGRVKIVISVETGVGTGTFTTKFVAFNSTSDANVDTTVVSALSVAAGVRVRVAITNREPLAALDVYATVEGTEN